MQHKDNDDSNGSFLLNQKLKCLVYVDLNKQDSKHVMYFLLLKSILVLSGFIKMKN